MFTVHCDLNGQYTRLVVRTGMFTWMCKQRP